MGIGICRRREWHEAKDKDSNQTEDKMTGDLETQVSALIILCPVLMWKKRLTRFYNQIEVTATYTWQAGCVGEFL